MKLIKALWYGLFADYHIRKGNSFNANQSVVRQYHFEMALHYYHKAYGKEFQKG
ncbi:hypothetical protein [Psychrobacillus sp. FJAT-21963]|uniref:hypothetical protein n=1 Tax=Psychrobacillus sp. FJAT-21963 TaxID=1712028 RepID=UPI0012E2CDD7|nr:hypothetical protein [Psychrobacillus sp. FJAT-21963]